MLCGRLVILIPSHLLIFHLFFCCSATVKHWGLASKLHYQPQESLKPSATSVNWRNSPFNLHLLVFFWLLLSFIKAIEWWQMHLLVRELSQLTPLRRSTSLPQSVSRNHRYASYWPLDESYPNHFCWLLFHNRQTEDTEENWMGKQQCLWTRICSRSHVSWEHRIMLYSLWSYVVVQWDIKQWRTFWQGMKRDHLKAVTNTVTFIIIITITTTITIIFIQMIYLVQL